MSCTWEYWNDWDDPWGWSNITVIHFCQHQVGAYMLPTTVRHRYIWQIQRFILLVAQSSMKLRFFLWDAQGWLRIRANGQRYFCKLLLAVITDLRYHWNRRSSLIHPPCNWPEICSSRGVILSFECVATRVGPLWLGHVVNSISLRLRKSKKQWTIRKLNNGGRIKHLYIAQRNGRSNFAETANYM